MKEIKGYLIDRSTGVGIASEPVTFKDLSGADIATGTHGTVWQEKDSVTQADGSFKFRCELSPGPIQVFLDISATEKKARKWDEKAQMGIQWSSDISRVGRGLGNGFTRGYLNDLALSIVSGHTFRIGKGQAIIDGVPWSLENIGGAAGYDILGTANDPGSGINPRLDLVSLRQYKEDAAGQLAGKQDVVVTLGNTSNVVPATPTGADFTVLNLGVLSTAEGAAVKTISEDKRVYISPPSPSSAERDPLFFESNSSGDGTNRLNQAYFTLFTLNFTGLDKNKVYDGYIESNYRRVSLLPVESYVRGYERISVSRSYIRPISYSDYPVHYFTISTPNLVGWIYGNGSFRIPIAGLTGVTSESISVSMQCVGELVEPSPQWGPPTISYGNRETRAILFPRA